MAEEMSRQVRRRQARIMAKVEKRAAWLQKRREKRLGNRAASK